MATTRIQVHDRWDFAFMASGGLVEGGASSVQQASPAVTLYLSGPPSLSVGVPATFAMNLGVGTVPGPVVVTPVDGGVGGVFTPATLTFTNTNRSATFTYTAPTVASVTIAVTNAGGLVLSPAGGLTLPVGISTTYTFTGPSSGTVGLASSNFTLTPTGSYSGTITVTLSGGGLSGTIVKTWSNSSAPQTFTITPTSVGTVTLTPSNSGGLTNPASKSYAAMSSQVIDATWLADNAYAFGGDPVGGPWVLAQAFSGPGGNHPLPPLVGSCCPYILAVDVAADGIGFVNTASSQFDLNGHTVTYDNSAPWSASTGSSRTTRRGSRPRAGT